MRSFSQQGITLIEAMIAISIIAIIASLAAPSFSTLMARQRIKGLGNEIMSDLFFSKMESAQSNQCIAVDFSATGYTIKKLSPYISPCDTATASTITTIKTVSIDGNNTINPSSGNTYLGVIFDPVRTTAISSDYDLAINISNNSASSSLLQISVSLLGRPKICSPSGSMTGFKPC